MELLHLLTYNFKDDELSSKMEVPNLANIDDRTLEAKSSHSASRSAGRQRDYLESIVVAQDRGHQLQQACISSQSTSGRARVRRPTASAALEACFLEGKRLLIQP